MPRLSKINKQDLIDHREELKKSNIYGDIILSSFTEELKYDYTMPEAYYISKRVSAIIEIFRKDKTFSKKILNDIELYFHADYDSYSDFEYYMGYDHIFGKEWFCGVGTLYRWRPKEFELAEQRIEKYISKKDIDFIRTFQEMVKPVIIHPIEMDKMMNKIRNKGE